MPSKLSWPKCEFTGKLPLHDIKHHQLKYSLFISSRSKQPVSINVGYMVISNCSKNEEQLQTPVRLCVRLFLNILKYHFREAPLPSVDLWASAHGGPCVNAPLITRHIMLAIKHHETYSNCKHIELNTLHVGLCSDIKIHPQLNHNV